MKYSQVLSINVIGPIFLLREIHYLKKDVSCVVYLPFQMIFVPLDDHLVLDMPKGLRLIGVYFGAHVVNFAHVAEIV